MGHLFFRLMLVSVSIKGIILLISSILISQSMNAQISDKYQWKNRVLLMFAPDATETALQRQLSILTQNPTEVTNRDLIFYKIFSAAGVAPDDRTISGAEALAFRKNYLIEKDGFTLILVGKDGTEKLRKREPVSLEALVELIDRMPMRRQEMRKNGNRD